MKLKQHYDKLLHILCTFTAMCFLRVWIPAFFAILIVVIVQLGKVVWNWQKDELYHPAGDVVANLGGFLVYSMYGVAG